MPSRKRATAPSTTRPWLRHYDYWVPPHLTYPGRPLSEILDTTAIDIPDKTATVFLGAELTFRDIKTRSDRFAIALARRGVGKGDRVGIMLPNCPQYVIAAFAVLRLGAIVVNVNPSYTAREVLNVALDSGMCAVLTLDRLAPLLLDVRDQTGIDCLVITSLAEYSAERAAAPHVEGTLSLAALVEEAGASEVPPRVAITSEDVAVLQYTGGTTGTPKGAMLTHGNIFANVIQTETWQYRSYVRGEARYLLVIPYFHIYAFTVGMLCGTWIGATQILIPQYDVERVLTAIRDYRPTYFPAVPTIFVSLLRHPRVTEYGLDLVRTCNTGGAPCPIEVIEEFERRMGRTLNEGYLSETSPVTHSTPQLARRKPGTIGLPLPDTDIKVVDLETGTEELPLGGVGELCIAGPQVMKGYWNNPDETAHALRPDAAGRIWFHTGDVAQIDGDGFTSIVQRKKDLIIVDGFNVYPSEVEGILYQHPAVLLAAVIGVSDPYHGEIVKACLVFREGISATTAALAAHCEENLAEYKRPRHFECRDALPMSAVGKILYRVLRDELQPSASPGETRDDR